MPDWKQEIRRSLEKSAIDPAHEPDVVEELAQHVETHYQELLLEGVDESKAREAALNELREPDLASVFPSAARQPKAVVQAEGEQSSGNPLQDFIRDLKHGCRNMRKSPGFTFFTVLTLGLGIGASTAVFTLVNTLLLHPLPVDEPSKLAAVYTTDTKNSGKAANLLQTSYLNLKDYAAKNSVFSNMAGYSGPLVMTMAGDNGPQRVFGQLVTDRYFETLGIHPAKGRFFLPDENRTPGSAPVAVLSYNAWQGKFAGAPDIIGRKLEIDNTGFTVVGIAPKGFIGVSAVFGPDFWFPATMAELVLTQQFKDVLADRGKAFFHGIGRLNSGATLGQAQDNFRTLAAALAREYPQANENRTASVLPITNELYSSTGGSTSLLFGSVVLLAIVGLLLLIACSNIASLLLARTMSRRQEIAIRLAIGADRGRVVRQMLAESILLALAGGAAGLAFAYAGCSFLWSLRPAEVVDNFVNAKLDLTVFVFAFIVSLITGLIFGVVPASRAAKTDVIEGLKEETRSAGPSGRSVSLGNALLVGQVALSLISLITAALFLRSIQHAYSINPGFDTNHLAMFMMNPEQAGYDRNRTIEFHRAVPEKVATLPGVASATWASNLPFWSSPSNGILIEAQEQRKKSEALMTIVNTVDLDYFNVLGIPLLTGRDFSNKDQPGSVPVAIVNEYVARKYWPNGDAVGRRFRLTGDNVLRQIVGVVKNANYSMLGEPAQPCVYLPLRQNFQDGVTLYVRSQGDPASMLTSVQREIQNLAPKVQVSDIRTGTKLLGQVLFFPRIIVSLLSLFGAIALVLASVGLYGLLAYSVNRREREIGVRMAIGAAESSVLRLIMGQGMKLVGFGLAIGLAVSLLIGRALSRALFGLSSADPVSIGSACLVLLIAALLACYLPARKASRVDPMVALREE